MPQVHDLPGRIYVGAQRYPDLTDWSLPVRMPLFTERADTQETEEPYRVGRGRVFRLWPSRWTVVVGRWGRPQGEQAGLRRAVGGRDLPLAPADICAWPGAAPTDDDGVFADTPGVIVQS